MRVSLATLGCKVNQYDTQTIAAAFAARGDEIVPFPSPADVYVVNTCSVTQEAVRKSRQIARRARRLNPEAIVVVTGCHAQVAADEAAGIPGVDMVVGPQDRGRIADLVREYQRTGEPRRLVRPHGTGRDFLDLPALVCAERSRAWLKVQDGCDQRCAYCQIPLARGPSRSLPLERVRAEAERLLAAGYQELVLTGIHLGAYGSDLPGRPSLASLVAALDELPGLKRLRLGSVEPNDLSAELIEVLAASSSFCPHLHLPLQSGNDEILANMRRPYSIADFARTLAALRRAVPGIAISTDLIVGFPGESAAQFESSLSFVREMGFARLHVFPFSARPGTAAAAMPGQLPRAEREARSRAAAALGAEMSLAYNRSLVGRTLSVLVEDWRGGTARGLAGQYVETRFPAPSDPTDRIVRVAAAAAAMDHLDAVCLDAP